ncbi:patatin-like phospholipase family protein [Trinickia terrae]|uniref:Patatin-like phospholipase family protein n=1 Tax=Trinickia terrae TaxID=2571161 RepID=A0A4U1I7W2_9BURK|nr:patatin-like phospholipase family protein [Trinickia terrae]TKC89524.1 patatin-like phospholipase family protein [Trinickia terrae]
MRLALVLMGGGARAAYQAGALKALAEIAGAVDPARRANPFTIICGTSAGAINATSIASHADDFMDGAERLTEFWSTIRARQVYRTDWPGVAAAGARWLAAMSFGWAVRRSPRALFDNAPLAHLLHGALSLHRIEQMLDTRALHALSITALSYSSGRHLTFYQAGEPIQAWRRAQRTARMVALDASHLLASSAIPYLFPAVPLEVDGQTEYFGDGSIRQIAPLSPAIHFGADRIVVLGAAAPRPEVPAASGLASGYPSLAQIGQQVLASVFLDSIGADIERIEHINGMLRHLPHHVEPESGWRHVDVLAIAPSERIELIAARHLKRLPLTVRGLLGAVGGNRAAGAAFASYLLFEAEFASELIELGYRDTLASRERLSEWIDAAHSAGGNDRAAGGNGGVAGARPVGGKGRSEH